MKWLKTKVLLLLLLWQGASFALPDIPSFADCPDIIHNAGFQQQSQPSSGVGGNYPGAYTNQITVNNTARTYYSYIPSQYSPNKAWPLLMVLHGAASPGQTAQAALFMRNFWQATAEQYQMIVVAPVASGSQGWIPGTDSAIWAAILGEMESDYNIEVARYYGWGFSAGGHVGHWFYLLNSDYFAAYAVNAGVLAAYAGLAYPSNANRKIPVLEMVGTTDTLYPNTLNDQTAFLNAGWQAGKTYQLETFSGGHVLNNDAPEKVAQFLCDKSIYD